MSLTLQWFLLGYGLVAQALLFTRLALGGFDPVAHKAFVYAALSGAGSVLFFTFLRLDPVFFVGQVLCAVPAMSLLKDARRARQRAQQKRPSLY